MDLRGFYPYLIIDYFLFKYHTDGRHAKKKSITTGNLYYLMMAYIALTMIIEEDKSA